MAKITFITADGQEETFQAEEGSVMELATENGVAGIDGECGGVCSCATCHVYLEDKFREITGEPEELEKDMLEFDEYTKPNSRLSCQIQISEKLDGIRLTVARE